MNRRRIAYGIPLCAALLCAAPILFRPGLPAYHHDWSLPFTVFQATSGALAHLSTWDPAGLGHPNPFATANPLPLVIAALSVLTSAVVAGKLVLLMSLALGGAGVAALSLRAFGTTAWPAAAAGVVYVASPYVANEVGAGHVTLWVGYALLPWCVERAVAVARSERGAVYGLALAVALSTLAPQFLVFDCIAIAAITCIGGWRGALRALAIAGAAGIAALVPTFWAFAHAQTAVAIDVPPPLGSWEDAQSVKLPDALLLVHYIEPYARWVFGGAAWLPWITVAVAAAGLVVWRDRRIGGAIVFVALVGLAFETGTQGPLGGAWRGAFAALPAAAAFRELYSACALVALALACGAALASESCKRLWRAVPIAAVIAASFPMLAFGLARAAENVVPPASAAETANAVEALPAGRIVPLPLLTPIVRHGVAVGGVDAFAPSDDRHPSMTEYLASFPVTALAASGGPADAWWRDFAAKLGATGVVTRDDMRSADADRLRSSAPGLTGASPPGVVALHGAPLVSFATSMAPQPLSYHETGLSAFMKAVESLAASGALRPIYYLPSAPSQLTLTHATGNGTAMLQSSYGPLPPDFRYDPRVVVAQGQRQTDDPAIGWVDAERWRARTPAPSAAVAGGAFTVGTTALVMELAPGDPWWLLAASDRPLTIRAGGATVQVPAALEPVWTELPNVYGAVEIRSSGGRAVVYRAARGISAIPAGPFAAVSIASFTRSTPWHVDIRLSAPAHGPALLIFRERYADGWRIEGARERWHGTADGYANAWLIDDAGQSIALNYAPQAVFNWLAAMVLLGYVALAWFAWRAGRAPTVVAQ